MQDLFVQVRLIHIISGQSVLVLHVSETELELLAFLGAGIQT